MVAFEHARELRRDALRQYHRHFGADAQEFEMLDGAQAREQPFELVVANRQRIAAGKQAVADFADALRYIARPFPTAR